jgi:hypothetical protein
MSEKRYLMTSDDIAEIERWRTSCNFAIVLGTLSGLCAIAVYDSLLCLPLVSIAVTATFVGARSYRRLKAVFVRIRKNEIKDP